jgi:outer membrane protein assembly factor BamB
VRGVEEGDARGVVFGTMDGDIWCIDPQTGKAKWKVDALREIGATAAILGDSAEVPKALLEEAQRVVLRDGDNSRFGVVQAITLVAHETNKDPDVRFAMERLAGDYLAAA